MYSLYTKFIEWKLYIYICKRPFRCVAYICVNLLGQHIHHWNRTFPDKSGREFTRYFNKGAAFFTTLANNLIHTSTIRDLSRRQSLQKNLLHTSIRELPFRYTLQRLYSILQPDKVGKQASLYFNRELHVMKEHTASVKVDKTFRSE